MMAAIGLLATVLYLVIFCPSGVGTQVKVAVIPSGDQEAASRTNLLFLSLETQGETMKRLLFPCLFCLMSTLGCAGDPPNSPPPGAKAPALRTELLNRTKSAQAAYDALINWKNANGEVDLSKASDKQREYLKLLHALEMANQENTKWLKVIVEKSGWPSYIQVGRDGAQSAWLILQQSHSDLKFQRSCLDLMTNAPTNIVPLSALACLTDQVLLAEGKKQLYGTEFIRILGKLQPRPIEDEQNVDKRRAEMGLSTLADYDKTLEHQYDSASQK